MCNSYVFIFSGSRRDAVPGAEPGGAGRHRLCGGADRHGQVPLPREAAARLRHRRRHHKVSIAYYD